MSKIFVFISLILCTFVFSGVVFAFPDNDYFGFLEYTPHFNVTYLFNISSDNQTISFQGVNDSNANHYVIFPFDYNNSFLQRINYVWYHGFFNYTHLEVTSYVLVNDSYLSNFTEISPGVYNAYFTLNESFFDFGNSSFNVTLDLNSNLSIINSFDSNLDSSTSPLLKAPDFRMAAHLQRQGLIETLFVENETYLEVYLWVRENLFRDGLVPQWTNPIYPVSNLSINLISPLNGQIFESDSDLNVSFEYNINHSNILEWSVCRVNLLSNNSTVSLNSSQGLLNLTLPLGNYQWSAYCDFNGLNITSDVSSFTINENSQNPVITLNSNSEEGGRRRRALPVENLSLNSSFVEPIQESSNSAISLITGAVIGIFGNKGALAIGILLFVIGIVALLVYNRERFGLVKKTKS